MITIDRYAYVSKLADIDPKSKMVFTFLPLVLCLFFQSWAVSVFIFIVMLSCSVILGGLKLSIFLKSMSIPAVFLIFGSIALAINIYPAGSNILAGVSFGDNLYGVTGASLLSTGKIIVKAIAAVSCIFFLSFTTPITHIFQILRKSYLPAEIFSLAELIYRYIFIIFEEAARIKTAQCSRLGYNGFRSSIYCSGVLGGSLFLRAYRRAERSYTALESRCYSGVFSGSDKVFRPCPAFYAATAVVSLIATVLWVAEKSI